MGEEYTSLGKLINSRLLLIFFIFMAISAIMFHPLWARQARKSLELQESIKNANKGRIKSFGGTSMERME